MTPGASFKCTPFGETPGDSSKYSPYGATPGDSSNEYLELSPGVAP